MVITMTMAVYYDWLNPGGYYYTYSYYPTYSYSYYPTYYYPTLLLPDLLSCLHLYRSTGNDPVVTTPVVHYDPVVYDPWWAANVYGLGATTYYYSSSWSWSSYHRRMFFR